MSMTHREVFLATLAGNPRDRFAFDLPCTPPIMDEIERHRGTRDPRLAFDASFAGLYPRVPQNPAGWMAAFERLGARVPEDAEIDAWGITHVVPPAASVGKAYHFRTMLHPLEAARSRDQLETLPWPDFNAPANFLHLAPRVAEIRAEGRAAVGGLECTLFEHAWYIRGMDNLFMDIAEENGIADFLLDFFTARSRAFAAEYARAGVDVVALGDDVGTQRGMMMSLDMWRTHLKPRLASVIAAARDSARNHRPDHPLYIRYHSDGDIRDIIPDLIEVGVDILNPMQPECMPPDEVIARYKDRLAFWGLIGTQSLMPFGTPAEIAAFLDRCVAWHRSGARLIIAPTHVLEPDVPYHNIEALVDAIKSATLQASGAASAVV